LQALNTVDNITSGKSLDPEDDWRHVKGELQRCYGSIARFMEARSFS
jgi:hypothetical protein